MKLPEKIVKLLGSGYEADIEIGLELSLKYADNRDKFRELVLDAYHSENSATNREKLSQFCLWRTYFDENKNKYEKGDNIKTSTIK